MDLLQKHFDTALDTPDGIKKLRELILKLAMQGKLVPQDPMDQSASELLKEIEKEKQRLIKVGNIKKLAPLPAIKSEELLYELPNEWKWVRLNDISSKIHYGFTASANQNLKEVRLLRITDIQNNEVNWDSVPGCEIPERMVNQYLLEENDILIARTGGTVGKSYLVENIRVKAVFASYLIRIIPSRNIHVRCLKYFIESPIYWTQLYAKCSGTGQPNVNGTSLSTLLLPLPPLAEQKRIVAKIDELMMLCDKLETQRNTRNQKRFSLNTSAINSLITAIDKPAFNKSWQFINKNFDDLYSVTENVTELKKAILQLAVMGKLVPQDPKDQPARELLKDIEREKQRLAKEGKIRKQDPLSPIKPEEILYELPLGWEWVRVGNIAQHNSGKTLDSGRNKGVLREYITTSSLYWGRFVLDNLRTMPISVEELAKCTARKGDLLICEGGEAGRAAVWDYENEICIQNHIHRVRFYCDINPYYGYRFFEKINCTGEINNYRKGVGISNMSGKALSSILFPLPPLAEQKRIVVKIDELMALCDSLDNQINTSTEKRSAIFNAILAKV
jgi:type I restriction enzyme S subunit